MRTDKRDVMGKLAFFLSLSLSLFGVIACIQTPSVVREEVKKAHGREGAPEENLPGPFDFGSFNYLQDNGQKSSTFFNLRSATTDDMYLRGEQVDAYIKDGRSQKFHCLVSHYPESTHHKILAVAARPYAKEDRKKGSKEYLFLLRPGVKDENILHCESEALTGALATLYPGESIAYLHDEVCPGSDCLSSLFTSDPIALFDDSGKEVSVIDIDLSPLRIRLDLGVIPTGEGEECTLDCVAKGFDCCSLGQCVRDGQPNEDAKDLPHYEEIVEEVLARPALASRYPEYFHLCAVIPRDDGTGPIGGGNTLSPEEEFRVRFQEKEDLYRCTTPHDGEAALCTVTFTATATATAGAAALPVFQTGADDRNFQTIYQGTVGLSPHSVVQVAYGGGGGEEVLEEGTDFTLGPGNDDLTQGMAVTLALPLPQQETLKIRYLVDGSCREVSRTLAKCSKDYVQGQNKGEVDDHFPSSNSFLLPFYADTGKAIKATVAGIPRRKGTHWELVCPSASLPCRVEFQSGHPILDTEDVQLTFYVNTSQHPVSSSVKEAQKRIAKMCQCNGDSSCALRPMGDPVAVDYECDYTPPSSGKDPPLQKTVFLSAKTVPVRYYDQGGAYHATIDGETPPQEGRPFEYRGRNKLQPNNEEAFVGFNEIYGSLSSKTLGSAVPAKEVVVKKGVIYNIFVNSGSFATCLTCGTDYFSHMARIFPSTFQDNGRGYTPDDGQTNPLSTPLYRAHDLIFGRACFVPTPMIPWSHRPDTDADATVQRQRLRRLETQHFLQANGLGRDWYGFDYASLIGSFDGVAWFSIGSGGRRVKAKSNRLFLAINAYFGDLTSENTYVVVISQEAFQGVLAPGVPIGVQQDFASDGAKCQRYHQCEHDDDCAANLGWEYTCEEVRRLRSRWPVFGNYAQESLGKEREGRLVTLFGIPLSGSAKRCVYRGRGGPCALDYEIANRDDSYAGVNAPGIHACTMNNSCQTLSGAKFNNKIRRVPYSVAYQNHNSLGPDGGGGAAHQFGLMSPIIGRPYDYNGSGAVDPTVSVQLDYNGIEALCLPGRNPEEDISHRQQNGEGPGADFLGDPVNALGMTVKGDAPSAQYLSSCSIFDAFGDYYHLGKNTSDKARRFDSPLDDALLVQLAGTQALPTNSLEILEDLIGDGGRLLLRDYFQSSPVMNPVNALALQKNRCLRAPGSRCHTDIDCGPSPFISSALARLNPEEGAYDGRGRLNKYELLFWKEALVCGQREGGGGGGGGGSGGGSGGGDERVCCREDGKKLTIGTLERPSLSLSLDLDPF